MHGATFGPANGNGTARQFAAATFAVLAAVSKLP
jgi:hypothetical protein